jgi:DEAD/DEAH box helicase domain-containing protein
VDSACPTGWKPAEMGAPLKNIVYFDLETQKSALEVGGWGNARAMRISLAVTYSTLRDGYRVYLEKDTDELVKELLRADLVVGFNHVEFDYEVLHAYTAFDLRQAPALDLLHPLRDHLGHRIGLDAIADATLGLGKTGDGMDALKWFKEGRMLDIAEYCCYDVKLTKLVHEFGRDNGQVFYFPKRQPTAVAIPVKW